MAFFSHKGSPPRPVKGRLVPNRKDKEGQEDDRDRDMCIAYLCGI